MRVRKVLILFAVFAFAGALSINIALACVGRTLNIAYKEGSTEQRILAELVSILIEERTGTKVVLKGFEDTMEVHRAMQSNEIQLYVEYTGVGLTEILGKDSINDPKEVFKTVRDDYEKNFNFIWLKTFGFNSVDEENGELVKSGVPCEAAPVVRKDTLQKYPALARLLNKLNNKMDHTIITDLITKVDSGKAVRDVAGQFLAQLGISFNFTPSAEG